MNEFEELVFQMRTAQINYYRTPKHKVTEKKHALTRAKELESKVDNHLGKIVQPEMFD